MTKIWFESSYLRRPVGTDDLGFETERSLLSNKNVENVEIDDDDDVGERREELRSETSSSRSHFWTHFSADLFLFHVKRSLFLRCHLDQLSPCLLVSLAWRDCSESAVMTHPTPISSWPASQPGTRRTHWLRSHTLSHLHAHALAHTHLRLLFSSHTSPCIWAFDLSHMFRPWGSKLEEGGLGGGGGHRQRWIAEERERERERVERG